MTTPEAVNQNDLTQSLVSELGYTLSDDETWLQANHTFPFGRSEYGITERLPAILRVSLDGTQLQHGVYREDVSAYLAYEQAQGSGLAPSLKAVEEFWPADSHLQTIVEEDIVYFGVNIEPEARAFQLAVFTLERATEIAVTASIYGETFETAEFPHKTSIADGSHSGAYYDLLETNTAAKEYSQFFRNGTNVDPIIKANNLSEFPTGASASLLTEFRINGEATEMDWEIVTPRFEDKGFTFTIRKTTEVSSEETSSEVEMSDVYMFNLQVDNPDFVASNLSDFNNQQSIISLSHNKIVFQNAPSEYMSLKTGVGRPSGGARAWSAKTFVDLDSIKIVSGDGSIEMILRSVVCDECEKPEWKFRNPDEAEFVEIYARSGFASRQHTSSPDVQVVQDRLSTGEMYYSARIGSSGNVCLDCTDVVASRYILEHPFASRRLALKELGRLLLEADMSDVQLANDDTYYGYSESDSGIPRRWITRPFIEYSRADRVIRRWVHRNIGDSQEGLFIADDGSVKSDIKTELTSREAIDFRA